MNLTFVRFFRRYLYAATLLTVIAGLGGCSKQELRPPPRKYFSDYVGTITSEQRAFLNSGCMGFEMNSSVLLLAVYEKELPPKASLNDYCHRTAVSWKLARKGKDNSAVLFVFTESKQAYIDVGHDLQGVLTPEKCDELLNGKVLPKLQAGDGYGALVEGVGGIIGATQDTAKGDGWAYYQERLDGRGGDESAWSVILKGILALGLAVLIGAAGVLFMPLLSLLGSVFGVLNTLANAVTFGGGGGGGKFSSGGGSKFGGGGGASGGW